MRVNGMSARQHVRRFGGMEQIFQANGAVVVELIGFAPMTP
jgi:hypothetical protein